jgi:hypothetical protein
MSKPCLKPVHKFKTCWNLHTCLSPHTCIMLMDTIWMWPETWSLSFCVEEEPGRPFLSSIIFRHIISAYICTYDCHRMYRMLKKHGSLVTSSQTFKTLLLHLYAVILYLYCLASVTLVYCLDSAKTSTSSAVPPYFISLSKWDTAWLTETKVYNKNQLQECAQC